MTDQGHLGEGEFSYIVRCAPLPTEIADKRRLSDPLGQQARQSKAGNAVPTIRAAMKIIAANTPRLSRRVIGP